MIILIIVEWSHVLKRSWQVNNTKWPSHWVGVHAWLAELARFQLLPLSQVPVCRAGPAHPSWQEKRVRLCKPHGLALVERGSQKKVSCHKDGVTDAGWAKPVLPLDLAKQAHSQLCVQSHLTPQGGAEELCLPSHA